jgi:hypothetical protein
VVIRRLAFLIWGAALGGFCRDFNRRAWTFWDGMRRETGPRDAGSRGAVARRFVGGRQVVHRNRGRSLLDRGSVRLLNRVETEPGTDDPDDRPVQALAMPSSEQAREMAACLLRVADGVDFNNDRDKRAAWLKPPGHPVP